MKYQTALLATSLLILPAAQAETYVIPHIGLEHQNYKTEFVTGEYTTPTVGLSVFLSNGIYVDIEGFTFMEENDPSAKEGEETKVSDREEFTISSGYRLDSGITLFAGWKDTMNYAEVGNTGDLLFTTTGPFIGVSDSIKLNNHFRFSLSGAVAFMTGNIEAVSWDTSSDFESYEYEGDALGYSTSAVLNISIYKGLMAAIGGRFQSYDYGDQIAKEEITSLFAKIAYRF